MITKNLSEFFLFTLFVFPGCAPSKSIRQPAVMNTPSSFNQSSDTSSSINNINWRNYFTDALLVKYIDTALKNNLDLLSTTQQIEIAKANVLYHKGLLLPSVSAGASAGLERYGQYTSDYAGNKGTDITPAQQIPNPLADYFIGLQSSWEIDVTGKLRNMKQAAAARYLESIEGRNWAVTNLVAEVATNYYQLLALYNEEDIISQTISLQQNSLELIQVEKTAGRANELAVKQAEAQLLNSKNLLLETQQEGTETESYFNALLGRYPQPLMFDSTAFSDSLPAQIKAGVPSQLLANRPDIKQYQFELTATKADVQAAHAAFFPSLNITAALGFESFNPKYLFLSPESIAFNILGNLVSPLINRSAIKADFQTANANQLQAFYNYQKSIINGFVEVHNELSAINNLQQMQVLKAAEVEAQKKSVEISLDLFKAGRATYLEVILAEQNALQSKLELTDIKKRQFLSSINIYKALGGGWR